jgi:hypothetical protein
MTTKNVRVIPPNGDTGIVPIQATILTQYLLHAAGGGFTVEETAKAIEARHTLHEGGEVVLGNWRFEAVPEGEDD